MKLPVLPPYIGITNNIKYNITYSLKYNIKYSSKSSPAVAAASAHICTARQFRETSAWQESHEDIHAQNSLGNHLLHATLLVFAAAFYWR